jgi:hypothetical protein
MRSEILFKIGNEIVLIEEGNLNLEVIETIKFMISDDYEIDFDDVEVVFVKGNAELSDFEVNFNGKLVDYNTQKEVQKVTFGGDIDDFLDIFSKKVEKIDVNKLFLLN